MKNWISIIIIIVIALLASGIYYVTTTSSNSSTNYNAERTSAKNNSSHDDSSQEEDNSNSTSNSQKQSQQQTPPESHTPVEAEEVSSFSTKIFTKDSSRQNNITITCSTLNNTDIANGKTFSFCNTVGQASPSKGYTKADIFTNGKKTKGYGGGNCQISTTLYNAVLKVPNLKVTERHEHSNKVPYIQSGKDAAVSYGSYDFKFVNNTGNTIRIKANHTADSVTIKLIKVI